MKYLTVWFHGYIMESREWMKQISRQRLSHQVYEILKEMIINHRFSSGTRINVEQLAKELGVSRTPAWEAVHRLLQDGLLENIPNRGVFITTLTPLTAVELYTVREALEGMAGRLAALKMDDRTLKRLEKLLEDQKKVVLQVDLVGYSKLDFEFHSLIYESCGNQILQDMLETIKHKMRPLSMHVEQILPDLYRGHCSIVKALKTGDPDLAEKMFRGHNRLMIEHIEKTSAGEEWKEVRGIAAEMQQSDKKSTCRTVKKRMPRTTAVKPIGVGKREKNSSKR